MAQHDSAHILDSFATFSVERSGDDLLMARNNKKMCKAAHRFIIIILLCLDLVS